MKKYAEICWKYEGNVRNNFEEIRRNYEEICPWRFHGTWRNSELFPSCRFLYREAEGLGKIPNFSSMDS